MTNVIDQSSLNLLQLIPGRFKRAGQNRGGEWKGACPFCGGHDRFIIHPNHGNGGQWWCRQCGQSGNALSFYMKYHSVDVFEACERLGLESPDRKPDASPAQRDQRRSFTPAYQPPKPEPPIHFSDLREYPCFEPAWQKAAYDFADKSAGVLWDNWSTLAAAKYLEQRGITKQMAVCAFLGFNPHDYRGKWGSCDVWLPRGITIPWEIETQLWNVRVRRSNVDIREKGGDKYMSSKGCANGMYRIGTVTPGCIVVMTEGEFDALILNQYLTGQQYRVVSIGSSTGAHLVRWAARLAIAEKVILAFDNDDAGRKAAIDWTLALGRGKVKRVVPDAKDITEMWQQGLLAAWVERIGQ